MLLPYNKRKGYQVSVDEKDKNKWITPEEIAWKYEVYSEAYLNSHPDDDISLIIWMRLAMAKAVLHKWQKSYEAAVKSLSKELPQWHIHRAPKVVQDWRKILIEFKDELIKRSLAHNK